MGCRHAFACAHVLCVYVSGVCVCVCVCACACMQICMHVSENCVSVNVCMHVCIAPAAWCWGPVSLGSVAE